MMRHLGVYTGVSADLMSHLMIYGRILDRVRAMTTLSMPNKA